MSAYDTILTPWSTLTDLSQLGVDPDAAISAAAAVALEAVALWVVLVVFAALLSTVPGALGRVSRCLAGALTPVLAQRAAAAVIGVVGVAAPSTAWAVTPTISTHLVSTTPTGLDLPAPGQPAGDVTSRPAASTPAPVIAVPSPTAPVADGGTTVTVQPGDTLWSLARASLPPGSSDPSIAAAWPHWWQLNRAVIGADPGLLLPGQTLQAPSGAA